MDLLSHEPNLIGVSSLAAGADQLFAQVVLEIGGVIDVVVPAQRYRATFSRAEDLALYETLLAQAREIVTLPFDEPSEEAFAAAGRHVVNASDCLVAVWDGQPARGLGGTADVVDFANRRGLPVVVIWSPGLNRDS